MGEWGRDLTPSLSSSWLANPTLLELKFGYELLNTDIPGRHIQLFRDIEPLHDGNTTPGFMLKVTLVEVDQTAPVPEPATVALLGIGLAGLAGVGARRKWKKKTVEII